MRPRAGEVRREGLRFRLSPAPKRGSRGNSGGGCLDMAAGLRRGNLRTPTGTTTPNMRSFTRSDPGLETHTHTLS